MLIFEHSWYTKCWLQNNQIRSVISAYDQYLKFFQMFQWWLKTRSRRLSPRFKGKHLDHNTKYPRCLWKLWIRLSVDVVSMLGINLWIDESKNISFVCANPRWANGRPDVEMKNAFGWLECRVEGVGSENRRWIYQKEEKEGNNVVIYGGFQWHRDFEKFCQVHWEFLLAIFFFFFT